MSRSLYQPTSRLVYQVTIQGVCVVDSVTDSVNTARRVEKVVVRDVEGQENEGEIIMVAEFARPDAVSLIVRQPSGLSCAAIPEGSLTERALTALALTDLRLSRIRPPSNNPRKRGLLEGYGRDVSEQVPAEPHPTAANLRYLSTKRDRLGHTHVARAPCAARRRRRVGHLHETRPPSAGYARARWTPARRIPKSRRATIDQRARGTG